MGLERGLPVALASVFYSQDSVGIFNLLTREDKRRQGYGTDILSYILEQSKAQGFAYATLSASSHGGLSLYEGVGFKSLGAFECFEYRGSPIFNPSL